MKITLEFDENLLSLAIKKNLEEEISLQQFIRTSIRYYNDMLSASELGKFCGYTSNEHTAKSYMTQVEPLEYLK